MWSHLLAHEESPVATFLRKSDSPSLSSHQSLKDDWRSEQRAKETNQLAHPDVQVPALRQRQHKTHIHYPTIMAPEANKARGTSRQRIQKAEDTNILQESKTKEMDEARN